MRDLQQGPASQPYMAARKLATQELLGEVYLGQGHVDQAERTFRQLLDEQPKLPSGAPLEGFALALRYQLGLLYWSSGRLDQAATFFAEALEGQRASRGPEDFDALSTALALGQVYMEQRHFDKAEKLLLESADAMRKRRRSNDLIHLLGIMVNVHHVQSQYEKTDPYAAEMLTVLRDPSLIVDAGLAALFDEVAAKMQAEGKLARAEELRRAALEILRNVRGNNHPDVAMSLVTLSGLLRSQQRYAEAEPLVREALSIRQRVLPKDWSTTNAKRVLAVLLIPQGKYEEAERLLLEANEEFKSNQPPPSQAARVRDALKATVDLYEKWGKPQQAAAWRAKLPATQPATAPTTRPAARAPTTTRPSATSPAQP
jgi:tetratricopeptide (TPR) repeat protein